MATYYVATTGSDGNPGTEGSPKLTIANALGLLAAGDTLYIRGGTYTGSSNAIDSQTTAFASGSSWGTPVTIASYPGEVATIQPPNNVTGIRLTTGAPSYLIFADLVVDLVNSANGTDADSVFLYTAHHCRFLRCEIKNGKSFGVHYGNDTTFNEMIACRIHDHGYAGADPTVGHGLYITGSDNLFEDCEVYDNYGYGFNIYNNAGPQTEPSRCVVRRNRIYGNGRNNQTAYGLVVAWGQDNVVVNNLIYDNWGGVQLYTNSRGTLFYHNTVYSNSPGESLAMQYYADGPVVYNNIFYDNATNTPQDYGGTGNPDLQGNLLTDPSFVNAGTFDFRLQSGSAARNAGITIASVLEDFARSPRPNESLYDIGAYEYVTPVTIGIPTGTLSFSGIVATLQQQIGAAPTAAAIKIRHRDA